MMSSLESIVCFKKPSIYDLIVTLIASVALFILVLTYNSQLAMQKDYVTKEYLFEFYITRNQILFIERERIAAQEKINNGADFKKESEAFVEKIESMFILRDRGGH